MKLFIKNFQFLDILYVLISVIYTLWVKVKCHWMISKWCFGIKGNISKLSILIISQKVKKVKNFNNFYGKSVKKG